jgi:probable rRNA maturation factor
MAAPRAIQVFNRQRAVKLDLPWLRRLATLALAGMEGEGIIKGTALENLREIDVTILSDRAIARIHRDFMDIPGPTDVLTFEHGEILISAQTAAKYAEEFHHPLPHELLLYIIHGLLHLDGYDDLKEPAAALMKKTQSEILRRTLAAFR